MAQEQWTAVDQYLTERLAPADPVFEAALRANAQAKLPAIDVTPTQGKFLHLLARLAGAEKILEIGTLGGYSTLWLAKALENGGRLVSLEASPVHAKVARANLQHAGLGERVEIRVAPALESLPHLEAEALGPFDLIFIDADKGNNPAYLQWALKLARVGTLIVVDNVIRNGSVLDSASSDPDIVGTRGLFDMLAAEPRLCATALQTVGTKGYDGLALALVIR